MFECTWFDRCWKEGLLINIFSSEGIEYAAVLEVDTSSKTGYDRHAIAVKLSELSIYPKEPKT